MSAVTDDQLSAGEAPADVLEPKIQLKSVRKTYEGRNGATDVLTGVNLDVRPQEFLAIVGPSGCGKSTLLHCIAGFEDPTGGEILIDGEPLRGPSPKRVFVFQEPGIFPWLTVAQNVGFGLKTRDATERAQIVQTHLEMVGLVGFEQAFPRELSGGMKQRVEFARALAVNPDVLYMDEPFGALDALTRLEMRREILRIWQTTKKTALLVTHDVEEAIELSDRIAVMSTRPATIKCVYDNPQSRPRDPDSVEFRRLRKQVYESLGVHQ